MSFLLDALRKSEDEKRRGAAPSIHGDEVPARSRTPSRLLLHASLIVVPLLLVLAWFMFRGGDQAGEQAPAVASQPQATAHPAAPAPEAEQRNANGGAARQATRPLLDTARTPVEQYQPEPQPARASSGSGGAQVRVLPDREPETVSREDALASSGETVQLEPPGQQAQAETEGNDQSPMPGLITYWELPASVRNDVLEMRISVMVFADAPEDRFILMNGKRWVEGDEPQAGLRVEEIRREGVVFTFRRYRFLVAQ